jgi:hypothetical protein
MLKVALVTCYNERRSVMMNGLQAKSQIMEEKQCSIALYRDVGVITYRA